MAPLSGKRPRGRPPETIEQRWVRWARALTIRARVRYKHLGNCREGVKEPLPSARRAVGAEIPSQRRGRTLTEDGIRDIVRRDLRDAPPGWQALVQRYEEAVRRLPEPSSWTIDTEPVRIRVGDVFRITGSD